MKKKMKGFVRHRPVNILRVSRAYMQAARHILAAADVELDTDCLIERYHRWMSLLVGRLTDNPADPDSLLVVRALAAAGYSRDSGLSGSTPDSRTATPG